MWKKNYFVPQILYISSPKFVPQITSTIKYCWIEIQIISNRTRIRMLDSSLNMILCFYFPLSRCHRTFLKIEASYQLFLPDVAGDPCKLDIWMPLTKTIKCLKQHRYDQMKIKWCHCSGSLIIIIFFMRRRNCSYDLCNLLQGY